MVTTREGVSHRVQARAGLTLMEILRGAGFDEMQALCGGCCACATCHVYVDSAALDRLPPPESDERELLESSSHKSPLSRLACQVSFDDSLDGMGVTIAPED